MDIKNFIYFLARCRKMSDVSDGTSKKFFARWSERERWRFEDMLDNATSVSIVALVPDGFVNAYADKFQEIIKNGGYLQILLVNPDGNAIRNAYDRGENLDLVIENLVKRNKKLLAQLHTIFRETMDEAGSFQVKQMDRLPHTIITKVESTHPVPDTLFVTLNGFQQFPEARPSFMLQRKFDGEWFDFYDNSLKKMWNCKFNERII